MRKSSLTLVLITLENIFNSKGKKYPIHFDSPISKNLKVKMIDGKKVLNTQNTNYSYGMLQEVLELGLESIPLDGVNSVLLLGMGVGCVIESLRVKFNNHSPVTAVELDPVVIKLAQKKFNIEAFHDLEVIEDDANVYISKTNKLFDLIIIDVFVDLIVPETFYQAQFWNELDKRLNLNGFALFNAGIDLTPKDIDTFLDQLPDTFLYQVIYNAFESNTVIILNKYH